MRWGQFRLRSAVHLISRLRRQLPLIGEALGYAHKGLPFQGRWLGEAETERPQQICDNLSVTFGDSSPERGAFGRGGAGPQYVVGDITSTTQDGEEGAERVGKSAESIKIGCIF